jgi:hypothetical protein
VVVRIVGPELAAWDVEGTVLAHQRVGVRVPLLVGDGHHDTGEVGDAREEVRRGLNLLGLGRDEHIEDLALRHSVWYGTPDPKPVALPFRLAEAVAGVLFEEAVGELVVCRLAARARPRGVKLVGLVSPAHLF